ncbi:MAG: hypothetical protein JXM70_06870 [Pirellulales bacterium]|nr:hypothetical protein [Pirellulales bacterium]
MRTLGIVLFIIFVASALSALGQDKSAKPHTNLIEAESPLLSTLPTGSVPVTPEMWFYEQQLREYLSPKMAVRRNAEFRAKQRRHRLASMRWFGISNARPTVGPDPWNGEYGAKWVGDDVLHPDRWNGTGWSAVMTGVR